jgi:phage baseplate assembly protein W
VAKTILYSDISNRFDIDPTTGDIRILTNLDAVRSSIENILNTVLGSRVYTPTFGSRIKGLLFEPMMASLGKLLEQEVSAALTIWDNRVSLTSAQVQLNPTGESVTLYIQCAILGLGQQLFTKQMSISTSQ